MPESIQIMKMTILDTLRKNKETHHKEYEEAMDEWVKRAKEKVSDLLNLLQSENARNTKIEIHLPKPISFEKEYEKAIKMLEYEVRDVIELSNHDFEKFFLDEWEWKNSFLSNTTIYKHK